MMNRITCLMAAAPERATGSFCTGFGFVDVQCPTVQFLAIAIRHRFGGLGFRAHLHKGKSSGLPGELFH
jgi:hypothetical protein